MGYRIVYRPAKKNRREDGNALRRVVLTGAAFALFVQLVERFLGEGSAVLERLCSLENRAEILETLRYLLRESMCIIGNGVF